MNASSAETPNRIYRGQVMHRRLMDTPYRFEYAVFSVMLDIDRLTETAKESTLFSYNRPNLFAFYDRDHGPGDGAPLRPWVEAHLARCGIRLDGGQIRLFCFPRMLGYAFNPLSVWYCHHRDGSLRAVLCEVSNTFGERHGYLLHEQGQPLQWPVRGTRTKCFHVSPFLPMRLRYHFRLTEPCEDISIAIRCLDGERLSMAAVQIGSAEPFTDLNLLRNLLRMPLMTFKVMFMIHWQALKLFLRRTPFHTKPAAPTEEVTP
jgi:hypothetical protein